MVLVGFTRWSSAQLPGRIIARNTPVLRSNSNYRPGKSVARPTPTILLSFSPIGLSFPLASHLITLPDLNGATHYAGLPIIVPTYDIRSSDIARKLTRSRSFIDPFIRSYNYLETNSLNSSQLSERLNGLVKLI